jgi:hypothetical protein
MKIIFDECDRIDIPDGYKPVIEDGVVYFERIEYPKFEREDVMRMQNREETIYALFNEYITETKAKVFCYFSPSEGLKFDTTVEIDNTDEYKWERGYFDHYVYLQNICRKFKNISWNTYLKKYQFEANENERFFYYDFDENTVKETIEELVHKNSLYWLAGNYFKTKEEAEKITDDDKKVFLERFKEIEQRFKLSEYK